MPCITQPNLTEQAKARQRAALAKLLQSLAAGSVKVTVGKSGGLAFVGWAASDREGVSDLCAYRALMNQPDMRRAVLRAEAMSGNKIDPRALASGLHSHDNGATWSRH